MPHMLIHGAHLYYEEHGIGPQTVIFAHGLLWSPRSAAFLATSPAASMTLGFDVFVQLVIAAMTIKPWSS